MAIKTNERPGTRAVLRNCNISSYKAREVLDLIRGLDYQRAAEILEYTDRAVATVIGKLLRSAAANAEHNEGLDPGELYVATCYADEGATLKRWRPRARGRATRIRKRSCHITIILARMPEDQIARRRARAAAEAADRRARRVAGTRRRGQSDQVASTSTPTDLIFDDGGDVTIDTVPVFDVDDATVADEGDTTEADEAVVEAADDAPEAIEAEPAEEEPATEPDEVVVADADDEAPVAKADATASEEEGN